MTSLHKNIKNERILRKYSQEFVAEKLEVSRQAVSKWETGQSEPSMNNLMKLARLFEVEITQLIDRNELQPRQIIQKDIAYHRKMHLIAFIGHLMIVMGSSGLIGLYDQNYEGSGLIILFWGGSFLLGLALLYISLRDYVLERKVTPLYIFGTSLFIFTATILPIVLPYKGSSLVFVSNLAAIVVVIFLSLKFWRYRWST